MTVMFFNTENFYAPQGLETSSFPRAMPPDFKWNLHRYNEKMVRFCQMLESFRTEFGTLPDLLGLSEIGGRRVIRDITQQSIFQQQYDYCHYESLDERGVDTALLYHTPTYELISAEPISFVFEMEGINGTYLDTTRDVLHCQLRIRATSQLFHVFVLHLPSKREQDVNQPKRQLILQRLLNKLKYLRSTERAPIILMGDFNENSTAELLANFYKDATDMIFQNGFRDLYQAQNFSTFHLAQGLLFDQILVSKEKNEASFLVERAGVFAPPTLKSWHRKSKGRPFRTFAGGKYIGGLSDHFPVYSMIRT